MHPDDAAALALEQGMLARVETEHGAALLRVMLSEGQQPGSRVRADPLVGGEQLRGPHRRPGAAAHRSLSRASPRPRRRPPASSPSRSATTASCCRGGPCPWTACTYWRARACRPDTSRYIALDAPPARLERAGAAPAAAGRALTYEDERSRQYRTAVLRDGRLEAVLYVAPSPMPAVAGMAQEPASISPVIAGADRRRCWPAGRSAAPIEGPIVCACFQVGRKRIEAPLPRGRAQRCRDRRSDARRHQLRLVRAGAQAPGRPRSRASLAAAE